MKTNHVQQLLRSCERHELPRGNLPEDWPTQVECKTHGGHFPSSPKNVCFIRNAFDDRMKNLQPEGMNEVEYLVDELEENPRIHGVSASYHPDIHDTRQSFDFLFTRIRALQKRVERLEGEGAEQ